MKKILLAVALSAVCAPFAFSQTSPIGFDAAIREAAAYLSPRPAHSPVHPGGLGIGVLWGASPDYGFPGNVALSLKIPSVPVFWGIRLGLGDGPFWMGLQGDYYIIGSEMIPTLSWFLGIGGYVNTWFGSRPAIGFGVRAPVGLTWHPISLFEFFFNVAPQIGAHVRTGSGLSYDEDRFTFPYGGYFGFEIGLRLWF